MGQCQQCHQTLSASGDPGSVCRCPEAEDTEGGDDLVVRPKGGGNVGSATNNNDEGLLAIWKWDEKPWVDQKSAFDNERTSGSLYTSDDAHGLGEGALALARHLLFAPHQRYKFGRCYRSERKIGAGTYGDVYEATVFPSGNNANGVRVPVHDSEDAEDERPAADETARRVAVKAFVVASPEVENDKQKLCELARRRSSFEVERSVLSQLEHPHIVKMHECFEEKGCLYIVLELCRGGELYERIAQKVMAQGGRGFPEGMSRHLFRQMLYATGYLHANRIVHRDIKTENFLLLGEPGSTEADVLKLCDFGTAVRLSNQRPRSNGRVGTLSYMAPEVYANKGADVAADVWSLGVVLYLILVGANPFRNSQTTTKTATVRRIESGDFDRSRSGWNSLTKDAQSLVYALLQVEEEKRLTCGMALRSVWVQYNGQEEGIGATAIPRRGSDADLPSFAMTVLTLLIRFSTLEKLQKVVLITCAQTVTERDLDIGPRPIPWYHLFIHLDADGDGRINFAEFVQGFKNLLGSVQVTDEKLMLLARALDTDGSNAIEWGEWLALGLLGHRTAAEESDALSAAFRLMDRPTGDGTVGAADLLAVLDGGCLGAHDARQPSPPDARQQVLDHLGQWSSSKSGGDSQVAMMAPPSLSIDEVRRVFKSVFPNTQP